MKNQIINSKIGQPLSRLEMKQIKAGEGCYLHCVTPGLDGGPQHGCWYRDSGCDQGDEHATSECADIYPAYDGNVAGTYDEDATSNCIDDF